MFILKYISRYPVRRICHVGRVHPSGHYAWLASPLSNRAIQNKRLVSHIRHSWLESGLVYGYRKVTDDLRDLGETCSQRRVYQPMCNKKLRSQTDYYRRPGKRGGSVTDIAPNHLQQQFTVDAPNRIWMTDITYIRTHEGWLFLAAALDLFSRQVIGWSMGPQMDRELALNALFMAVWHRQPGDALMVHSDHSSQFSSYDWQAFWKAPNLQQSMSHHGNCYDNTVTESFFQLLKRERIC